MSIAPDDATLDAGSPVSAARPAAASPAPREFAPGAVLAGRYRISSLLGRGGMGEVYRADDLTLGHAVALKFLPPALAKNSELLERFHGEVRNARQVSHPNVCRVYDIGEIDGQPFLTMEYIDGEDLASLLRRIGRLPADKALEIAHQLCAGLAAAHDRGVLHRDLKPANIMIDGRGRARITDFGLAVSTTTAAHEFAGTPAYMAPEQLAGEPATVRSDLFALGLVLYETFTGKRAFESDSVADLRRQYSESPPTLPPSIAGNIDPAIERALLRCLAEDPKLRPASALQLAAALPGGDPLAAALAAGETPSPEMVAAAGEEGAIAPRTAAGVLIAACGALVIAIMLVPRAQIIGVARMQKSPDVLTERAHDIERQLGYSDAPADTAWWIVSSRPYLLYRAAHEPSPQRLQGYRSADLSPFRFWYRQAQEQLAATNPDGILGADDPPMNSPGMVRLDLDGNGRLLDFLAVPPAFEDAAPPSASPQNVAPDWGHFLAVAGFDIAQLQPAPSLVNFMAPFDARAAWTGTWDGFPIQVDAATFHSRLVGFAVNTPWSGRNLGNLQQTQLQLFGARVFAIILFVLTGAGIFLARRNARLGRGDLRGAFRVALFATALNILYWLFTAHHGQNAIDTWNAFAVGAGQGLFEGAWLWLAYMSLEPMVRRLWPHLLISWQRLLSGKFQDPLVGRDLLVGGCFGLVALIAIGGGFALPSWFNIPMAPLGVHRPALGTPREFLGMVCALMASSLLYSLGLLFLLTLSRLALRRTEVAIAVTAIVLIVVSGFGFAVDLIPAPFFAAALLFALVRYGLLASVAAWFVYFCGAFLPMVLDPANWYAARSWFTVSIILAVLLYGFRCALAGRQVFDRRLLD